MPERLSADIARVWPSLEGLVSASICKNARPLEVVDDMPEGTPTGSAMFLSELRGLL
jgi:hypothetical protein